MRALTNREKRTIRLAAVGIGVYLVLFFGWRGWRRLEDWRGGYEQVVADATKLRNALQPYEGRFLRAQKLKETFRLDPGKLSKATLVAEASAAIQNAARLGGVQLGPMRESPARASAKELVSMQIEGVGPVPAVMGLLPRLEATGYPLILDSIQLTPDPAKPAMLKLSLTIILLDFEQWQKEEAPHA